MRKKALQILGKDLTHFLGHSGNYLTAAFLVQGLSVITLPLFTRLLSPSDYGVLAILASLVAILNIFYRMGLQEAVMRYFYEAKKDFDSFLGNSFLLTLAWALSLTTLLLVTSDQLVRFLQVEPAIIYIGTGIAASYVFYSLYEGYLVAARKSRKAASLSVAVSLCIVVLAVVLILRMEEQKFYGKAWAMLIANALLGAYSIVQILRTGKVSLKRSHSRYALLFGLPLIFHSFSTYLLKSFDVIIINQLADSTATGLYSVAYKVGLVQGMVSLAMLKAWHPIFFEKLNERSFAGINSLSARFAGIIYLCAFALILFARELMFVLTDGSFHEALGIIPIIVMAHVFLFLFSLYLGYALYRKKTQRVAVLTLAAAALNIALNYWLIPIHGYQVAAWTTLAAYLFLFVMHYGSARSLFSAEELIPLRRLLPNFFLLLAFVALFLLGEWQLSAITDSPWPGIVMKLLLLAVLGLIYFRKLSGARQDKR